MSELFFETIDNANPPSGFKRGDVEKLYSEGVDFSYPNIVLACDELDKYKIPVIQGILTKKTLLDTTDNFYVVYISVQGKPVEVGLLEKSRLKLLLTNKVFDSFDRRVHLDKDTTITGDLLYALCMVKETPDGFI